MDGIIVLDKPQDFTSIDAVAVVRGSVNGKLCTAQFL